MTGVEIVGIVLAVTPLCIIALEHHKDLFRPFEATFKYHKAAKSPRSSFSVVFAEFHQLMQEIAKDLALPSRQCVALFVGLNEAADVSAWSDDGLDQKFAQYFGTDLYKSGVVPLLSAIFDKIKEISDVLELPLDRTSTDTKTAWNGAAKASLELHAATQNDWSRKELKKRMKLVFKSGTLDPKCKDLCGMVEQLTRFQQRARRLVQEEDTYKPKSKWPLERLRRHARSLYRALEGVRRCSAHANHCLKLQLDTRLGDGARRRKMTSSVKKHSFRLYIAPDEQASEWHTFCMYMDVDVEPWRPSMVRFERQPLETRQVVTTGICEPLQRSPATSFCVDDQDQIHELSASDDIPTPPTVPVKWTTLSALLSTSDHEPTFRQTLKLALTIASSLLELYHTEWITDTWGTTEVLFLHDHKTSAGDVAYISLTFDNRSTATAQRPKHTNTAHRKTLTLAVMLLEIGTCKPLVHWHKPGESERETVLRYLMDGKLDGRPDCFVDAIRYCMKAYDDDTDLSLQNYQGLQEVATEVVAPFEEYLRYTEMPAPV